MIEIESNTLSESLIEQLELLIATPEGTVVLERNFGLNRRFLDMPPNMAQVMLAEELARKLERYIPSITLNEVRIIDSDNVKEGGVTFGVVVELAE